MPLHVPRIEIAADLEAIDPFVQTKDLPARGVAQPYSGIDHGLQNRLQVEFRSTDDSKQIRGGGLLLQQLIAFACEVADRRI